MTKAPTKQSTSEDDPMNVTIEQAKFLTADGELFNPIVVASSFMGSPWNQEIREQWVLREAKGGLSWTKAKRPKVALLASMVCALADGTSMNHNIFNGYRTAEGVVKVKWQSRANMYEDYSIAWDNKWGNIDDDEIPTDQLKRAEKSFANKVMILKAISDLKEGDAREEFMNMTIEEVARICQGMTIQEAIDKHIEDASK